MFTYNLLMCNYLSQDSAHRSVRPGDGGENDWDGMGQFIDIEEVVVETLGQNITPNFLISFTTLTSPQYAPQVCSQLSTCQHQSGNASPTIHDQR
jgi:hypothetical protein